MAKRFPSAFIESRAFSLASVVLTRRDDLELTTFRSGRLDIMARVASGDASREKYFGVGLHASAERLASPKEADRHLAAEMKRRGAEAVPILLPFPALALDFSMPDDAAFYTWTNEPALDAEGAAMIRTVLAPACAKFDRKALDRVVEQVKDWYDRLFEAAT